MPKQIWQVQVDQYGNECLAKSGHLFGIRNVFNDLVQRYKEAVEKPAVKVVDIGTGAALANMLEEEAGIPVERTGGLLRRLRGADMLITKEGDAKVCKGHPSGATMTTIRKKIMAIEPILPSPAYLAKTVGFYEGLSAAADIAEAEVSRLEARVRELEKSDVLLRRLYDCVWTDDFGDLCLTYAAEDVVKEIERVIGGE